MSQWSRVNDLFHAARALSVGDRGRYLAAECGNDTALREEVESLLAAHVTGATTIGTQVGVGTHVGDYEVTGFLAAGAMGEVYRARDTKLGREAALKVLPAAFVADPDRRTRFEREARLLASLNHPNIATIYGVEDAGGVYALALELVEGETLGDRIARGRLPIEEALRIARQIAEALDAAHEQGIIHRDLKPANIKLTRDGVVKVLDFGLARLLQPDAGTPVSPAVTSAGMLLGTPAYMSPEQARGDAVDKRTDLWAFGCVLYEMLTGRRAFGGTGIPDTLAHVLTAQPDWRALPPDTPPLVRSLVEDCFAKDRNARVAHVAAARFALQRYTVVAASDPMTRPGAARLWRYLIPIGAAVIVVVALALISSRVDPDGAVSPLATFRVPLPEGQQFTNTGRRVVAMSHDGSRIVYVANRRLYTRRLSELDPLHIGGTDFATVTSPALAPDGQAVVFYAESALRRVSTGGGAPLTLAAAMNPFGVSWDGDTIVYGQRSGILAVPATGGQPEVWIEASPEETLDSPQFIPQADAILFSATRVSGAGRWDQADIVIYSRDLRERKILIRGGSAARYLASGHIVYAAGTSLMAVPFDLQRLELTGPASRVLEGVLRPASAATGTAAANFAVSANGTLAYIPLVGEGGFPRTLVWVDRQGNETPVLQAQGRPFNDPRISPDMQRVAVQIQDAGDDIWMFDLVRATLTRHTFEDYEDETPMWAPDGQWIAYTSTEVQPPTVFRRRADGTGRAEALFRTPGIEVHPHVEDWTPDGRTLLIALAEPDARREIMLVPVDREGKAVSLIRSRFRLDQVRVSPNGRWLAYSSAESGRREIYVQPFPSLEGKWQISSGGGSQPVWSRNGDELFYRGEGSVFAVRVSTSASFAAGPPQKLFDDNYHTPTAESHTAYDVSADGRRFLMVKVDSADVQEAAGPQIIILQNWFEELRRLAPSN